MRIKILLATLLVMSCKKEDDTNKQVIKIPKDSNASIRAGGIVFENNRVDSDCTLTIVEKDGEKTTTMNCE